MEQKTAFNMEMPFGKYQGCRLIEIAQEEPSYIKWLLSIDLDEELKTAVEIVENELC